MNLLNATILLFTVLALKPTLIYSMKSLAALTANDDDDHYNHYHKIKVSRHNKRNTAEDNANKFELHTHSTISSPNAKLILSMELPDKPMRSSRGTSTRNISKISDINSAGDNGHNNNGPNNGGGRSTLKRERNFDYGKKMNKKSVTEEMLPNTERKISDGVYSATGINQNKNNQSNNNRNGNRNGNRHGNGNGNGNGNAKENGGGRRNTSNRNKQQQQQQEQQQQKMIKLEKHQDHFKHTNDKIYTEQQGIKKQTPKTSITCRYAKSAWSDCNLETNVRTRILTLKKGESNCPQTRTMEKKCKKSCRYEKGTWSECLNGSMMREDKLKSTDIDKSTDDTPTNGEININPSKCELVRTIRKKCNPSGNTSKQRTERKSKGSLRRKQNH